MAQPSPETDDLFCLIRSIDRLCWACSKNAADPAAARALSRTASPVGELARYMVGGLLEEMRSHPTDPQIQSMGVHLISQFISHDSKAEAAKHVVLMSGGVEVLVRAMQHHPTDETLLSGGLQALDELQGLPSLLQALDQLRDSLPGVRAGLWAFSKAAKSKWAQVTCLPPREVVRILLSSVDTHKEDYRVLSCGIELLSDLTMEAPETRTAFAEVGGWQWLLQVMDARAEHGRIQLHGCKLLSSLYRGGAFAEAHAVRASQALERIFCQHDGDDCVLYWAFWAVQQMSGARALIAPMRGGAFRKPAAMVAALKSLSAVSFGQGDGAAAEDMPAVIDAVVHAMQMFSERYDVIYEATFVLGRVAAFVVGCSCTPEVRERLFPCVQVAVNALLHVMNARLSDAYSVQAACDALAEVVESCPEESPVRASLRSSLTGQENGMEPLLGRIQAAHVSNEKLQFTVMSLNGYVCGVQAVLQQMTRHIDSHAVQMPAIRTLGSLFGGSIDLSDADLACLPEALAAVVSAMGRFPENIILQQNACYSLTAMAEHLPTARSRVGSDDSCLLPCATAAAEALSLVRGRCDSGWDASRYNTLYLRKEATRCIVALCAAKPQLSALLRERGLQEVIAEALKSTADSVWDGRRDAEAEETLHLELLALSYVLGPPAAILECLRRWGSSKPAVARAAADTVADLARSAMGRAGAAPDPATSDPALAAVTAPMQALSAAGCGAELVAAMQAHAADEDLQGRLHLAVGFVGCSGAAAAAA